MKDLSRELRLYFKYVRILQPRYPGLALKLLLDLHVKGIDLLLAMLAKVLFDQAFPLRDAYLLHLALAASAAAYVFRFLFRLTADYIESGVSRGLGTREGLFRHIEELPLSATSRQGRGELMVRVTKDVDQLWDVILVLPQAAVLGALQFLAIACLCFKMSPAVSLLALAAIPLHFFQTRFFSSRLVAARELHLTAQASVLEFLRQRLSQIFLIKAARQEFSEFDRLRLMLDRSYDMGRKQEVVGALADQSSALTMSVWVLFVAWFLGGRVVGGELTPGEAIAILLLLGQLGGPVAQLAGLFTKWRSGMVSIHRIEALLSGDAEHDAPAGRDIEAPAGRVEFRGVTFAYDGHGPVLTDVSLTVPPRSLFAIVGHSGAGKSTLVSLLLRLYPLQRGSVLIDGQDIAEAHLASLRANVALVSQNYSLFSGTIRENIAYARPDAPDGEVERAAREAACMEFIRGLPQGLETRLLTGEELSPGQRQRIALARALLLDPPIYVFDEATASLDPVTEYHFQQVMQDLSKRKTVIAIAHRLSTIKNADHILVLSHGRVSEEGAFEELMRKRGTFYHFYCRQFGGLAEFKKGLDIEHERCQRYGSRYSLAAFAVDNWAELVAERGEPAGAKLLAELEMRFRRTLRIGDGVAPFRDGILLLLLPELTGEKCAAFIERMGKVLGPECSVNLGGSEVLAKLHGIVVRVSKESKLQSTEKLIQEALKALASPADGQYARILDV